MNLQDDLVYRFFKQCYDAGISNPAEFLISKRPQVYDYLNGCFPRGIFPTDIDGIVECNHHYLWFEFKHENRIRNGEISKGQMLCMKRLSENPKFTVLLIGNNRNSEPTCIEIITSRGKRLPLKSLNGFEGLRAQCKQWSAWAEQQRRAF